MTGLLWAMRMVLTCWGVVDGSEDFEVEEDEQVGVVVHVLYRTGPLGCG